MRLNPDELIAKKRAGGRHTREELQYLVDEFTGGNIPDETMANWLAAVYERGLDLVETGYLTKAMADSGAKIDLSSINGPKVDKHSTGGVGDKVTLVAVPLAASAGVKVPKLSGHALGHTGGTLDKLHSIPGFRTTLSPREFLDQLSLVGAVIAAQSKGLAPADKKLYALRDRTGTVVSIPLIVSSILSKKAAGGAGNVLIDVKTGSGAFMSTLEESKKLANALTAVGSEINLNVECVISDMSQPLGKAIGNSLEVKEAIDCLSGGGPPDLRELALDLAARMVLMAGLANNHEKARREVEKQLVSGSAKDKFGEIIRAQCGDAQVLDDTSLLPQSSRRFTHKAYADGWLKVTDCHLLGDAAAVLIGGRMGVDGKIDAGAGLVMKVKDSEPVKAGDAVVDLHYSSEARLPKATELVSRALTVVREKPESQPLMPVE